MSKRLGTNVHVHSNHSFSVFASPAEAAAAGAAAGVEVLGLNDFFTVAGYPEFSTACHSHRLPAVFGIECIAIDQELAAKGILANDPANPGKIYLCGKGVANPGHSAANATLAKLRGFQEARNRQLIAKTDAHFRATTGQAGPTWADVVGQTPAGNTTERHVAKAILKRILELGGDAYAKVVGAPAKAGGALTLADADAQNQIRGNLLKVGKPCYAPEDPAAFPPVAEIRTLFLQLGAIPTYPVLGNPLTGGETDLSAWCDRLAAAGWHALELIPARNTDDRVAAVLAEAAKRGWPVFDGTEHNTPAMEPMTTRWGLDERFRPQLRAGALVLLGHQALVAAGKPGYVAADGSLIPGGYAACLAEGERELVRQSA
jgi:PHP domain